MVMVLLSPQNRILAEAVESKLTGSDDEKKEPMDIRTSDFDDVSYRVLLAQEDLTHMYVSMFIPCWKDLAKIGGEDRLKEIYGSMVVSPKDGAQITLQIDVANPPESADVIVEKIGNLKGNILGAPFYRVFDALNKKATPVAPFQLTIRNDTIVYFFPKEDRVTMVYELNFDNKTDKILAAYFMRAFASTKDVRNAPVCAFDIKPPLEMKHFKKVEPEPGKNVGFFSFCVMQRHIKDANQLRLVTRMLSGFRNYLQYHMKCAKAFFHSRMRARVYSLLQVLNRAKQDQSEKKKKTITGRTFVDKSREVKAPMAAARRF